MKYSITILVIAFFVLAGCGGGDAAPEGPAVPAESELTAAQITDGIGPITSVSLGEIDPAMAAQGEELFTIKCSACHKMETRYIGPALGDVLDRRSPAFVMNMILNPEEMLQKHPEGKKMLAEYMSKMANQNLTEAEARAVLEFIRTQ